MKKGNKHSSETKLKISKAKRGIKIWGGQRKGMDWMIGNKFRLGKLPWCAGTKGVCRLNSGSFKKGRISWNKNKIRPEIREKNHWNWKGGITPENHKIKISLEYKLWRRAVLERDNYTCQECGKVGGGLHVHHIKSFAYNPKLRLDINNGVTLCINCHSLTNNFSGNANRILCQKI